MYICIHIYLTHISLSSILWVHSDTSNLHSQLYSFYLLFYIYIYNLFSSRRILFLQDTRDESEYHMITYLFYSTSLSFIHTHTSLGITRPILSSLWWFLKTVKHFAHALPHCLFISFGELYCIYTELTATTYNTFIPINCHLDLILQVNLYLMLTTSPCIRVSLVTSVVWSLFSSTFFR